MNEFLKNISKRTWVRIVLVSILIIIVAFSFAGEKVACNNGIGWDGMNYYTSMDRFISLIKHHGYDQYAIRRIMPWGLVNVASAFIHFKLNPELAVRIGLFFEGIALAISLFFFYRISNLKKWKIETEIMGFSVIFYSFLVLKVMGYYPVFSDVFSMTIGLMLCYYFLADRKWGLIITGLAGAFIWPTSPLCAFALAFFPRQPLPVLSEHNSKPDRNLLYTLFALFATIPLVIIAITMIQYDGHIMAAMRAICPLTIPSSKWLIFVSCMCTCVYLYYIVSSFTLSWRDSLKDNFAGKETWKNYICFFLCLAITTGANKILANSEPGSLTTTQTLQLITMTSMTDPFVFIENHFMYCGLGYLLLLLLWNNVAKTVMKQGLGYTFVVMIWAFFSLRPEARVSTMYWMFPLIALLMYMDTKQVRMTSAIGVAIISLILSRFWYPFNVEGMERYLSWDNYWNYTEFPAQRYFMNFGHWQSHEMYYLFTLITFVIGIFVWCGIRKKWFVLSNK